MTLHDFITKKRREVQDKGPYFAAKTGIQEAVLKGIEPLSKPLTTPIWESDAEVILVLDSCRYDLWETVAPQYFKEIGFESRWSVGSASPQWISETFKPAHREHWQDAGYVTGNAFSGKEPGIYRSEAVYPVRELDLAYLDEPWVVGWGTGSLEMVEPDTITDRALWAWQRRDKLGMDRLVVHYMQPHVPFRSRPEWSDGWDSKTTFGTENDPAKKSEWKKLRDGEIDRAEFWAAYQDNLEYVLEEVARWINGTEAEILITSDHGNAMGEYGQWGHPVGVSNPSVRKVPWVHVTGTGKDTPFKELDDEPPAISGKMDREQINNQLEALGYK